MTDLDALTLTLFGEARGEPIEGLIGVAMVIRRRVLDRYRGATSYEAVCLAPEQFSCWLPGPDHDAVTRAQDTLARGGVLPVDLARCQDVARATMAGQLADNTYGANHYVTTALYQTDPPSWLKGISPLVALGHQSFFSLA